MSLLPVYMASGSVETSSPRLVVLQLLLAVASAVAKQLQSEYLLVILSSDCCMWSVLLHMYPVAAPWQVKKDLLDESALCATWDG